MITASISEVSPRFSNIIAALGPRKSADALRRALNRAGDMTRTAMKAPLRQQTGLKAGVINKVLKAKRANYQELAYTITVRGGDIRLKHFGPRETKTGVSATPFGARKRFGGTFLKGGRFPDRKPLNLGGQVFRRVGKGRTPLEVVRSGVILPEQVVKGETITAFERVGRQAIIDRTSHELNRLLASIRSRRSPRLGTPA